MMKTFLLAIATIVGSLTLAHAQTPGSPTQAPGAPPTQSPGTQPPGAPGAPTQTPGTTTRPGVLMSCPSNMRAALSTIVLF